jgi:hypothetical protein
VDVKCHWKSTLGRPRRRREDDIKCDFEGVCFEGVKRTELVLMFVLTVRDVGSKGLVEQLNSY